MKKQFIKLALFLGGAFIISLILSVLLQSCTPVRYVYVDQNDSVVRKQRVIYDNLYTPSPFFFNYGWGVPYYNPIIIQRQNRVILPQRRIVVPQRPIIQPNRWSIPQRQLPPRPPRQKG